MWRGKVKIFCFFKELRSRELGKVIVFAFIVLRSLSALGQNCDVDFPGTSTQYFSTVCGGSSSNLTLGNNTNLGNGDSFIFDASVNIGGNVSVNAEGNARIVIPSGVTVNVNGNFQLDQKNSGCSSSNPCIFEIEVNGTLNIQQNFQNNLVRLVWAGSGTVTVGDNFENSSNGCMDCGSGGCPGFDSNMDCRDNGAGCSAGDFCDAITSSSPPQITGQTPITINQGESVTITLNHLTVTDPDDNYPTGFTLTVYAGTNYTFSGATITPAANFTGTLNVPVSVNDGENESEQFALSIEVVAPQNVAPQITGQTPVTINQGQSTTITLGQLTVTDPDDNYPTGFTLTVHAGNNYTFSGATVTPAANFTGTLNVPVSVNDGEDQSNQFTFVIEVVAPQNVAPQITGQVAITINQGQSATITLSQLTVTDPDDSYPTGFTLTVYNGSNYTRSGNTITPGANFTGTLSVPVSVNDGEDESERFSLTIEVVAPNPQNVAPQITGQVAITINQGQSTTIALSQLTVSDPDDSYPTGFTLTVYNGGNYTRSGNTITPAANFTGTLSVPVSVNDGEDESERFTLAIEVVAPQNTEPTITGQVDLSITQGQSITIALSHLVVTDADNTYPTDFTLRVYAGNNYTFAGTTVTPEANFSGNLKVPVSVNDGQNESKTFDLKVEVTKVQPMAPQITAQKELITNEDQPLPISFADLTVVDPDNTYPQGFSLKLSPGAHYTVSGSTVTPEKDYSGPLSVTTRVNDGKNDSAPFDLQITVSPVNDAPLITGQKKLSTDQATPLAIKLTDLNVSDPDNAFPQDFTLNIKPGANYVAAGGTISPIPAFAGVLNVTVSVSDGSASSPDFNVVVTVESTQTNVPPTIEGQKAISITQGTPFTLQLSQLVVKDPDNEYPVGFTLKVSPGANYTVTGTTIRPAATFVSGTLSVGVRVNDGTDDSNLFEVKIQVNPISATPSINGQRELTMMEDSTITITLADLIVTDADNPGYPNGFTLKVLGDSEGAYQANGNTVRPSPDLNGFIDVGVTVSDGVNTSDEFRLAIFVNPVNDAPRITQLETTSVAYEPGKEPAELFRRLVVSDVDNDNLGLAEIGFSPTNHSPANDELLFDFDTTKIRVIRDPVGTLFLIGYATVEEYQVAIRSMRYNYRITQDLNGDPEEILPGSRTVYVKVNDGQAESLSSERTIDIEARIMVDIPSAFTPNGDNANDTWHLEVSNVDRLDQTSIKVYNKRGLLLYESDAFEQDWDGTFNGELLPVDTYYYTIVVNLPYVRQTYSGVVTILY
jgi:gliding motility-associated-like protein